MLVLYIQIHTPGHKVQVPLGCYILVVSPELFQSVQLKVSLFILLLVLWIFLFS